MNLKGHIFLKVYVRYFSLIYYKSKLLMTIHFPCIFLAGRILQKNVTGIGTVLYRVYTNTARAVSKTTFCPSAGKNGDSKKSNKNREMC